MTDKEKFDFVNEIRQKLIVKKFAAGISLEEENQIKICSSIMSDFEGSLWFIFLIFIFKSCIG